jgi:hypothetical protein
MSYARSALMAPTPGEGLSGAGVGPLHLNAPRAASSPRDCAAGADTPAKWQERWQEILAKAMAGGAPAPGAAPAARVSAPGGTPGAAAAAATAKQQQEAALRRHTVVLGDFGAMGEPAAGEGVWAWATRGAGGAAGPTPAGATWGGVARRAGLTPARRAAPHARRAPAGARRCRAAAGRCPAAAGGGAAAARARRAPLLTRPLGPKRMTSLPHQRGARRPRP